MQIFKKAPAVTGANNSNIDLKYSVDKDIKTISIGDIEMELNKAETDVKKMDTGILLLRSANQCLNDAKERAVPEPLCGELWFRNELCICFADSNVGKSIYAVQVGKEISEKHPDELVGYLDFELSDKQFQARYSKDYADEYKFPDNFYRLEPDPDEHLKDARSFEEHLMHSLEKLALMGFRILIIDNITYLRNETDKARNALPLMKELKALKKKYELSILVLAHTPKRDLSKPLEQNDLGGSKMIMNFCDSAFAIGASQKDGAIRYIKQIKARNTEMKYDAENVMVYQITKPDNLLFMLFTGYGCEREHLKVVTEKDKEETKQRVIELLGKGWSQRQIANEVGIAPSTVNKYIKAMNSCSP